LLFCDSDPKSYGAPCVYSVPQNDVYDSAGGTSFAAPALAGIFALVTQKYGAQGNPNYGFYQLAAQEYGSPSAPNKANLSSCNSTKGKTVASSCTFYDVTQGNIAVPCGGSINCFGASSDKWGDVTYGVLSESTSAPEPAYQTSAGWDFATGLGSVNATNLLNNWGLITK
jgi:subtilase family serine protease